MLKRQLMKAAAIGALLLTSSLAAHAEDVLAKAKAAGVLKVGTETAFAPFDFIDAGEHKGLNVDFFEALGKDLGVKIEWVELPWDSVLPSLEAGKFDVVAGPATITKARIARYRMSAPVAEASVAILKKAGDTSITKPADIAGKAVGVGKATAQLAQLQEYSATLSEKVTVREYVSFNDAYADLATGRVVAVANSLPNIAFVAKQRNGAFEVVTPAFGKKTYFGFIGTKDDDHKALLDYIDNEIIAMKKDGRLAKLQEKWFGTTFDTPDSVPDPAF
ncbi:transporter substrate-binding domain-containing protein [Aliirhizobium smilacinae]|uniref:Transporter substrate-binding domain-containing protein n=2 Tax=Aliirhizobium smilacinae TaxID=1395944 RepID=A0A5C4XMB3_9HYPH|nr:transporter substrate-binding domain-containing protein [Rhizobium smilacinae]TNM64001.1 transporter substrate-binding domain-containing protein [Rhizobium smilacinae]